VWLFSRWWCAWNAYAHDPDPDVTSSIAWISFPVTEGTDPSGMAWGGYNLEVEFSVSANAGAARSAIIRVGNMKFSVSQAAGS